MDLKRLKFSCTAFSSPQIPLGAIGTTGTIAQWPVVKDGRRVHERVKVEIHVQDWQREEEHAALEVVQVIFICYWTAMMINNLRFTVFIQNVICHCHVR